MSVKYFLDTNIFVYSFDSRYPGKQKKAQELIDQALSKNTGLISSQVVQEFLHVALRKFEKPLSMQECRLFLNDVLSPLCEVFAGIRLYHRALEIKEEAQFGFYDALIVAAASEADCKILYTEDLHNNQKVAGLTIRNPFV